MQWWPPMTENRLTIRIRVRRHVGSAIDAVINQAIKDAHRRLQRKHNYSFMETSDTITVSQGDITFTLPTDIKAIINPEIGDAEGTSYRRLNGILKDGITARCANDSGRPVYFRIWAGVGYLYPAAEAGFSFPLEYIRWLPEVPDNDQGYLDDAQAQAFLDAVYEHIDAKAIAAGFQRLQKVDRADYWENKAESIRLELEHDDMETALAGV